MPGLTLKVRYNQNQLIMSPEEMLETYFYGIQISSQDGKSVSHQMMKTFIKSATEEVEKTLDIKIIPTVIEEGKDFYVSDWKAWSYIRASYPVKKAYGLNGYINTIKQIEYPKEWLSTKKSNTDVYFKNIYLVPTNGHATTNSVVFSGITPHLGFFGNKQIPNYWNLEYVTGFDKLPMDLFNFIGKLAAINVFHILGDIILGAGIASQSIGIDGLSQSISTTSSATNAGYGARITNYLADMKRQWPLLKSYYKGMELMSM